MANIKMDGNCFSYRMIWVLRFDRFDILSLIQQEQDYDKTHFNTAHLASQTTKIDMM